MSIAAQLKSSTENLHRQTENLMPSAALLDGSLGLSEYGRLLSCLYSIHSEIENYLVSTTSDFPAIAPYFEQKLAWLVEDLIAMGLSLPHPTEPSLPNVKNQAMLVGMLYVLEGSMLGGQVILKGLRKNAALAHLPHRYYTGHGPMTGPNWKRFTEMMEKTVPPDEAASAVEGAELAFGIFQRHLARMT